MKWEIRYYLTEVAYKAGTYAYKEVILGGRFTAISIAENRLKHSEFKYFDIIEI